MRTISALNDDYVSINFEKTDGTNTLVDAIVVTKKQYETLTESDISNIEKQRWDDFLLAITPVIKETNEGSE